MSESGQGEPRVRVELSRGWAFLRGRVRRRWLGGEGAPDAERVDLPHCWNRRDTFENGAAYFQGDGAYRLVFNFADGAADAGAWRLRSEGFYGRGQVWLNGRKLASVDGQYLGLDLPLAEPPSPGRNVLAIRLENRYHRHVLPGIRLPDFLLYGGLAGRVWLEVLPRTHFVEAGTWVHVASMDATKADVRIPFTVQGATALQGGQMHWRLQDGQGEAVARVTHAVVAEGVVGLTLPTPQAWSVAAPVLYEAIGELRAGEKVVDCIRIRFGCRMAEFRQGHGFFLNGERCALHGCNRHEAMPGFGNALPLALHRADAQLLKAHGCNFVRLSHYPQHPAFLDACDELGILVYAEIATWKRVRGGGWLRAAERQLRGMIARDRHHPSVILWGMGNEGRHRGAYTRLHALAKAMDPTRPTIYAENHLYRARRKRTLGIPDVWGCNYELAETAAGAAAARTRNVVVSECSNYPPAVRGNLGEEAAQVDLITRDLAQIREKAQVAGFALWSFCDYATMRKTRYARHCGVFDAWRMPKMAAVLMEAMFGSEAVLQVRGDWQLGGAALRRVYVISNCVRVELRSGGQVLHVLEGGPWWTLDVAFGGGCMEARGVREGREVAAVLAPHGAAMQLALERDEFFSGMHTEGLLVVRVRVLDAAGVLVANWSGWVTVSLIGEADLLAHTLDERVPVACGLGRIFVMVRNPPASVGVHVRSDGLAGVAANFTAGENESGVGANLCAE